MKEKAVALLRGINVGGKNRLPMDALMEVFERAGCVEVETYIQSGNVVFRSEDVAGVGRYVRQQITARYGLQVPVVLRTAAEMERAAKTNPFLRDGIEENLLHVMFLEDEPSAEGIAGLDPARSPGDVFRVEGREVYLYLPQGVARTKLTNAYFDSKLKTVGTQRNWRTVLVLQGMLQGG